MTPKEKAEELVSTYRKEILRGKYRIDGFVIEELAEECALTAVDYILYALSVPPINNKGHLLYDTEIDYWQFVKQEIEKL